VRILHFVTVLEARVCGFFTLWPSSSTARTKAPSSVVLYSLLRSINAPLGSSFSPTHNGAAGVKGQYRTGMRREADSSLTTHLMDLLPL